MYTLRGCGGGVGNQEAHDEWLQYVLGSQLVLLDSQPVEDPME